MELYLVNLFSHFGAENLGVPPQPKTRGGGPCRCLLILLSSDFYVRSLILLLLYYFRGYALRHCLVRNN